MKFVDYFYSLVKQIPKGKVSTYGALARALGDIVASRAVGRMLNANPYAPIVPCHRVVMSDGSLGGFGAGIPEKIKRLKKEGVKVSEGHIVDFERLMFSEFNTKYPLKKLRTKQKRLSRLVVVEDDFSDIGTVGGVDAAYNSNGYGACAVFDYEKRDMVKSCVVESKVELPYIPTYLAFRELPLIEKVWKRMRKKPDILLVDGNGVLHPYGLGIASHVGVELEMPTIGVAKKLLCGKLKSELGSVGDFTEVELEGRVIGYALLSSPRTKKPIYISPGHRVSFQTALEVVKRFCKYKVPEPIRQAHTIATKARNAAGGRD